MKGMKIAATLVLLLMVALPTLPAGADVDIVVTTDGDVDLNLTTEGNGTLLSIDYNGRDLLREIEHKIRTIENLRTAIASLAARTDVEDLQDEIEELDVSLQKLVGELNLVLNDIYSKVNSQAHIIGINPANNSVSITLISGNRTISEYIQGTLEEIDGIDTALVGIQLRVNRLDDTTEATGLSLSKLTDDFNGALEAIWSADREMEVAMELQGMDIQELRDEIIRERATRNNLTIMFVLFSIIAIGIVAMTRRP